MRIPRTFLLLPAFSGVFLLSCEAPIQQESSSSEVTDPVAVPSLAGQVYQYAPGFDTDSCQAYGECDCCSGIYLFINDKDFLQVDYCESDVCYARGTYEVSRGEVQLNYDGHLVNKNYNWDLETEDDHDGPEYFLTQERQAATSHRLTPFACARYTCFTSGSGNEINYVAPHASLRAEELISGLKRDSIWSKLQLR